MIERHRSLVTYRSARLRNKIVLGERALSLLCDDARDHEVHQVLAFELHAARIELAALRGASAYVPASCALHN